MDWTPYFPGFIQPSSSEENDAEPQKPEENQQGVAPTTSNLTSSGEVRRLTKDVEVADIGCGFGGLLVALAPKLPDTLMLGTISFFERRIMV